MSRGRPTVQSRVVVGTTSRELASYLMETTGTGRLRAQLRSSKPTWRPIYWWDVSSRGGASLLKQLLPYLKVKRELALLYIELAQLKAKSTPGRRYEEPRQREIVEQMQVLNKRGRYVAWCSRTPFFSACIQP